MPGSDDRSQALRVAAGRRKLRVVFRKVNYRRPQAVAGNCLLAIQRNHSSVPLLLERSHPLTGRTPAANRTDDARWKVGRTYTGPGRRQNRCRAPRAGHSTMRRLLCLRSVGGCGSQKKDEEKNWVPIDGMSEQYLASIVCFVLPLQWRRRRLHWRSFCRKILRRRGHRK